MQIEVPPGCEWFQHQIYIGNDYVVLNIHVPQIQLNYTPQFRAEEEQEKTKMPQWVVVETSDTGHKERKTLTVEVKIDGQGSVLSEGEIEALAKSAAEAIGVKFVGKA